MMTKMVVIPPYYIFVIVTDQFNKTHRLTTKTGNMMQMSRTANTVTMGKMVVKVMMMIVN